jgi:outer membrane lipoprotein-sorting protein
MKKQRVVQAVVGVIILSGLLILLAWAFPPEAAATGAVSNFEIHYSAEPFSSGGSGTITLYYSAPDSWRIETTADNYTDTITASGDRVLLYDAKEKAWLLMARDQAAKDKLDTATSLDLNPSRRYQNWQDYLAKRKQDLSENDSKGTDVEFLNRPCYQYASSWAMDEPSKDESGYSEKSLMDKQLLVPLSYDLKIGGEVIERLRAVSVKVNAGLKPELFNTTPPEGARVFKGRLSGVPSWNGEQEGFFPSEAPPKLSITGEGKPFPFYAPDYLPAGFSEYGSSWEGEGSWMTFELAGKSGATLVIEENRTTSGMTIPLPPLPDSKEVAVGKASGKIAERSEPFKRVVLVWAAKGWRFRIDAGEVPASEVVKIAASMTQKTSEVRREPKLEDPKAIQAKLHFLVLVPKQLPEGIRLIAATMTPAGREGDSVIPEQLSLDYQAPGMKYFNISEMGSSEGTLVGWQRIKIGDRPGWYRSDKDLGSMLQWDQEGTEVGITGNISKEEMLKLAESFVPADPSARERIKQYQSAHPHDF